MLKKSKNTTHIPVIKFVDDSIKYTKELKFLGLVFDRNHSWFLHVNHLSDKITKLNYQISTMNKATWGLRSNIIK